MTARLVGTGNEELVLGISAPQISPTEPDFVLWALGVSLAMPRCFPAIQQSVETCFYQIPSLDRLTALLEGDSGSRFAIDELNFQLEIYEQTLNNGPRSGFIVDVNMHSTGISSPREWPGNAPDQILHDHRKGTASLNFAFAVDQECLKSFHRDLKIDFRRCSENGG